MPAWETLYRVCGGLTLLVALLLAFLHLWEKAIPLDHQFQVSTLLEEQRPRGNLYAVEESVSTFSQDQRDAEYYLRLVPTSFSRAAAVKVEKNGIPVADFLLGEITLPLAANDRVFIYNGLEHKVSISYELWSEKGRETRGQKSIIAGQRAELSFE